MPRFCARMQHAHGFIQAPLLKSNNLGLAVARTYLNSQVSRISGNFLQFLLAFSFVIGSEFILRYGRVHSWTCRAPQGREIFSIAATSFGIVLASGVANAPKPILVPCLQYGESPA